MSKSKTEKQNKFKLKPLAVAALVICALVVIYSATTAWLTGTPLNPLRIASLDSFSCQTRVFFLNPDNNERTYVVNDETPSNVNAAYRVGENGSGPILLSTDVSAVNYVGRLRVEIRQVGNGVAFTRVKITQEWLHTVDLGDGSSDVSRLQSDLNLPFVLNTDDFTDKRNADGYVYHNGALAPGDGYVNVITGFDAANFDTTAVDGMSGIQLLLNVTTDSVQFNRYKQIWGIDSLPWRS